MKYGDFVDIKDEVTNENTLFTSEFVTEGHPDKLADQISDGVLDNILKLDSDSRVACECLGSGNMWTVAGEVTANISQKEDGIRKAIVKNIKQYRGKILKNNLLQVMIESYNDYINRGGETDDFFADDEISNLVYRTALEQIVLDTVEDVYNRVGYSLEDIKVTVNIQGQSPDIALGTNDEVGGAGDQGIMFGYAIRDTTGYSDNYMPLGYEFARNLAKQLEYVRHNNIIKGLLPDAKTQVTLDLATNMIHSIVISTQHTSIWSGKNMKKLRMLIVKHVIKEVIPDELLSLDTNMYINHTGNFVIGGIEGDAGLTGRKIIVDTYGGYARHGGGAFSGKDCTKVDRSGAYMARYIAKNIVANYDEVDEVTVQLGYVIGEAKPVSLLITSPQLLPEDSDNLADNILNSVDLTPAGIIERFNLKEPNFSETSTGGHFGRDNFPWESIDLWG